MKTKLFYLPLVTFCLLLPGLSTPAAVYYVNADNPTPAAPFSTWATAATNIQDAISVTSNGDTVLVTNGVYAYGGAVMAGTLANRVALSNAITVQSVNGPWVTTIQGAGATNGPAAVRCAWLTNGAALIGFTLESGATLSAGDTPSLQSGGGAWCASSNALVGNCVMVSNTANYYGGGVYQGTVQNSLISSNGTVNQGGGAAYKSVLINCSLIGNTTYGAVSPLAMTNCIIYYNGNGNCFTVSGSAFSQCCTTPALAGTGNFTTPPLLFADGVHLTVNSPCIGAGTNVVTGTDVFGNAWSNPPAVGCAEGSPLPILFPQPTAQFPPTGGVAIGVNVGGQPPFACWWTKDGVPIQNDGHYTSANTNTFLISGFTLSDAGGYQVVVSNSFGMVTSAVSQVAVHCVALDGAELPPYSDWSSAATNIQDAINVAQAGDIILVTNGVYAPAGGLVMAGSLTNGVALYKPVLVQSVNGPWVTVIQGGGATNGYKAIRCAWLTNGAALVGFTLQGGATSTSGDSASQESGGGVWCASSDAVVENCLICSNTADYYGGGVYLGTLRNCAIYGNNAHFAGGSYASILNNCTVTSNNTGNTGGTPGGTLNCAMTNCIIYYNSPANTQNSGAGQISYCCTYPLPSGGIGNFTNLPQLFVDHVHLYPNSACIGAGTNVGANTDIDGRPWANPPAIGCSEAPTVPFAGPPSIQFTTSPLGFTVNAAITGGGVLNCWWLENGTALQDDSQFTGTQTANLVVAGTANVDAGGYQLVVSNAFGLATSTVVQVVIHCVDAAGTNPIAPYLNWSTAATNIQDAIAAANVGEIVLATNGVYATGGKSMDGVITNRVSLDKAILLQSVNGANATIIQGAWDPTTTNGPGAIRCAWMTNQAVLGGFTLRGGATRASPTNGLASNGGGVFGTYLLTPGTPSATVADCVIIGNAAARLGGGAYRVVLNHCTIATNLASGNSAGGAGGGAQGCNLLNCVIAFNTENSGNGGGVDTCNLTNCALIGNSSYYNGGAANGGTLINCTVTANTASGYSSGYGAAVYGATLYNCIVFGNFSRTTYPNINYASCNLAYSCTDPLALGTGNIDVNPQLLPDGIHLAANSPCIGAGTASVVFGTDIDGQAWNNPPSIGCDEWQSAPFIVSQPSLQVGSPAQGLTCSVLVVGQSPFAFFWSQNGVPIQDDGHYGNSGTANLTVNHFGPADAGSYQVVVTNSSGAVTSAVLSVVIHAVNVAGANPVSPFSSWSTAATNIQDAINAAAAGDIVLVTNGLYATGGLVMAGDLTNRVALNKALTVVSVNGWSATAIQGAWDPQTTNGPGAVRCAYVADGAVLNGFTLQNGATRNTGDAFGGGPLESGGGIWCNSINGIVVDCVLSNNAAIYGGGLAYGSLNNSLVLDNFASAFGGAAYSGTLNNCTVGNNYAIFSGGGTYSTTVRNSIVQGNYMSSGFAPTLNNYYAYGGPPQFFNSCTSPTLPGNGNINVNPQFLDFYHVASTSPCRGAGSPQYASGTDLDGEPWANSPTMGCDEVILTNLIGPLSANIVTYQTNVIVNKFAGCWGYFTGRASTSGWSFGDGATATNSWTTGHQWANPGDFPVTYTVYNNDNPAGVAATVVIHVQALAMPQLQSPVVLTNGFRFQFGAQLNVNYTIQYATNLVPPVVWKTLQTIYFNNQDMIQIVDGAWTNTARFYRVLAQ